MKMAIIGAGRGVGRHAVEQALDLGHDVTAFARNADAVRHLGGRLTITAGDVTDPADVQRALAGQDTVLCTLGADDRQAATTLYSTAARNLAEAMPRAGVDRLIFLSNFGVLGEGSWHPATALLAMMVRRAIEGTLADHRRALDHHGGSPLRWTAVRPMALTKGARTGRYRVAPEGLPFGGTRISRADVADFMLKQIGDERYLGLAPAIAY
jgi:putative NADH-flavin reductase